MVRALNYAEAVERAKWHGERMTHAGMQPGCVMRNDPTYNPPLRREWPNGDGCTFIPYEHELTRTDWVSLSEGWG